MNLRIKENLEIIKEIVVILEALENFKKDIEEFEPDSSINKMRFRDKLEEVNYLIEVIETGSDDAGIDALSATVVLKENI